MLGQDVYQGSCEGVSLPYLVLAVVHIVHKPGGVIGEV